MCNSPSVRVLTLIKLLTVDPGSIYQIYRMQNEKNEANIKLNAAEREQGKRSKVASLCNVCAFILPYMLRDK